MNQSMYVLICLLFLLGCNPDEKVKQDNLAQGSESMLNPLDDDFMYGFMNDFLFQDTSQNPMDWTKLITSTIAHDTAYNSFIESLDTILSKEDIQYMKTQIDLNTYSWICENFRQVVCLSPHVEDSIFSTPHQSIKTDSGVITKDAWVEFRKLYGNGGIHSYSKPIYNRDKTVIIIEHAGQGDWTLGSGDLYVFRKEKGEWQLIESVLQWIS